MAPVLSAVSVGRAWGTDLTRAASGSLQIGGIPAVDEKPDPRDQRDRRACVERHSGAESIPQPTGEHARGKQRDSAHEVEDAEPRAARLSCGRSRNERTK